MAAKPARKRHEAANVPIKESDPPDESQEGDYF